MPAIFPLIQEVGNIPEHDMYNTFNMGVGMMVIVDKADVEKTLDILHKDGVQATVIGKMVKGQHTVVFED